MEIIDSHHHAWKYDPIRHSWISDQMKVLKQNFLGEELKEVFNTNSIAGSVVVQADQSESETQFLLDLASKNDFIKAIVGWVDLCSDQVEERLEYFSQFLLLKGFRHIVQDEPDVHFMLRKDFQNGIAALKKHSFTYDILIFPTQLESAYRLVKEFPEQKFVIDHIAKPYIQIGKIENWRKWINAIAEYENVYCKVSGMVTEADWKQWKSEDFIPYLDVIFKAFGIDRIMFGSDYPVCLLAAEYSEVKGILKSYTQPFSEAEKKKIWAENAKRFYKIND